MPPANLKPAIERVHAFLVNDRGPSWPIERIAKFTRLDERTAKAAADWLVSARLVRSSGTRFPAYTMPLYKPLPWSHR